MAKKSNPAWSDKMFNEAVPAKEFLIEKLGKAKAKSLLEGKFKVKPVKMGRPAIDYPKKQVTLRLDPDILGAFKATGKGWQSSINNALRQWLVTLA